MTNTPNQLITEKSPYLLQHAYNPVNWYPWIDEAFEKALAEDKPIFLSIGYATCHWCHVMEKESFEDPDIAQILNDHYISIKVDREERPDIDSIYMDALHAMDMQGGWPLNMFLTPDKKPIIGGTYFPPVAKYGRKSFPDVLNIIANSWKTKREEIIKGSEELTQYLINSQQLTVSDSLPDPSCFNQAYNTYNRYYDETYYGFKTNSMNKFPPSMGLSFLLQYYNHTSVGKSLEMAENTLKAMKKGGIYDQIGGGLSRYSTDHFWLVPHFEKMLYDNALFLNVLAESYSVTKNPFFKKSAYSVIKYIERDMKLECGGIASAEDADSEGEEGKFYIWSLSEFRGVCGDHSNILEKYWNISEEGNFEGKNILNESFTNHFLDETSIMPEDLEEIIQKNTEKLLEYRNRRIRPLKDDKVLTSWNCLYIRALLNSYFYFSDSSLKENAIQIYNFIYKNLFNKEGRLLRRYREGESGIYGYLNDYAELALASIYLYKACFDIQYLKNAISLVEDTIRLFSTDNGVFYDTGTDAENLIRRNISSHDGVEPSGNSTMAMVFVLLSAYGIKSDEYRNRADQIFSYFKKNLEEYGISYPAMLSAYFLSKQIIKEIIIIADKNSAELEKCLKAIYSAYIPNSILVYSKPEDIEPNSKVIPLLEGRQAHPDLVIYVCENQQCKLPVHNLEELKLVLSIQ